MKLSMACVAAALSLTAVACTDEVPTGGANEISVKDTNYKASQDPKLRVIRPESTLAAQIAGTVDFHLIRFPEVRGISAEDLGTAMNHTLAGITQVGMTPGNLPAPFHPDNELSRTYDCLTTTSLTMAMNQPTGDITQTQLTNALNHDTTDIQSAYANLIVQHDNNGTIDTATVLMPDGTVVCQVIQTRQSVLGNSCGQTPKKAPPIGVGGC